MQAVEQMLQRLFFVKVSKGSPYSLPSWRNLDG
jgi:hypothetical protein